MIKVGHTLTDAQISERYEALGGTLSMPGYFYPAVAEFVGNVGNESVLDAGCGTGDLLAQVQRLNPHARLLGIELAQSRVDIAQTRLGAQADIRCGSITGSLPFAPECADVLLVTEVLEHLKDPVACIRNLLPLVKPDGHVIVTFPNGAAWLPWSALAEYIAPRIRPVRGFLPHEHPLRSLQPIDTVFSEDEVLGMLRQCGLRVTDRACYEVFPYLAEFAYKFAPKWDIAPLRRPFDKLATQLGWTALGYRVLTRSQIA
jgi:2-polyprenyl-3-methyl-5-hydroxy-6-metoxy-1,4-benzoquinol methylase